MTITKILNVRVSQTIVDDVREDKVSSLIQLFYPSDGSRIAICCGYKYFNVSYILHTMESMACRVIICAGALNLKCADWRIFGRRVASRRADASGIWRVVEHEDGETWASLTIVRKQSLPVVLLIWINFGLPLPWILCDNGRRVTSFA